MSCQCVPIKGLPSPHCPVHGASRPHEEMTNVYVQLAALTSQVRFLTERVKSLEDAMKWTVGKVDTPVPTDHERGT